MKDESALPVPGARRRKPFRHAAAVPEVQSVTNAAEPHSEEMHGRFVKYAMAMSIRMVCIGLVFVFDGWYKLVPIVGAVVLPWVAVIIANGGADMSKMDAANMLDEAPPFELEGPAAEDPEPDDAEEQVLTGDFIVDSYWAGTFNTRPSDTGPSDTSASDTGASETAADSPEHDAADAPEQDHADGTKGEGA